MSLKFPFAFILAVIIVALWRLLRNDKWEVLMITYPLLSNVHHRAMITPVSLLLTRLVHISPSCWTIYRSSESILEMGNVSWIGLQIQCSTVYKSIASKHIQSDMNYVLKNTVLSCIGQLGFWWMSPSKARANEVERSPTTNDIVLFRSPATWTWKARCGTQIYEQWQLTRSKEKRPS